MPIPQQELAENNGLRRRRKRRSRRKRRERDGGRKWQESKMNKRRIVHIIFILDRIEFSN